MKSNKVNYRDKIYKYYLRIGIADIAPKNISELRQREPFFQNIINNFFPKDKNSSILEIGCGHGAFQYFILKNDYTNSIGVDNSESQINEAKKLGIKNVIQSDLIEYLRNIKNESLDVLIAIDVIEHFSKEELDEIIEEFYRVLKKNGTIVTHQPNGEGLFGSSIRYSDFTHELAFTRNSIAQIFLANGFSDVKSFEDKPIMHGFKSGIRLFLWIFFVKPFYQFITAIETGVIDKEIIFSRNFLTIIKK